MTLGDAIDLLSRNVGNYQCTLRNISEDLRSHLHRSGSLQPSKAEVLFISCFSTRHYNPTYAASFCCTRLLTMTQHFFSHGANAPQWAKAYSLSRLQYLTQTHHTRLDSSGRVTGPSQIRRAVKKFPEFLCPLIKKVRQLIQYDRRMTIVEF